MRMYYSTPGSWSDFASGLLFSFDGERDNARATRFVAGYYFHSEDGRNFKNRYVVSKESRRITLTGKNVNMRTRPTTDSPVKKRLKGDEALWIFGESVEERQVRTTRSISALYNGAEYEIPAGSVLTTGGPFYETLNGLEIGVYATRKSDEKRIGLMIPVSALESWPDKMWAQVSLETGETGWVISDFIEEYKNGDNENEFWDLIIESY